MAVKKSNTKVAGIAAIKKAEAWDPNSEQQWKKDQEAGGAAWAQRFINTAGPQYGGGALRESIRDAELLFKGNKAELDHFYETLQLSCLAKKPVNPILNESFDDSLSRAQEFAAFLAGYVERLDCDDMLGGETEGHAMAIELLNDALKELNRQREFAGAAAAESQAAA